MFGRALFCGIAPNSGQLLFPSTSLDDKNHLSVRETKLANPQPNKQQKIEREENLERDREVALYFTNSIFL